MSMKARVDRREKSTGGVLPDREELRRAVEPVVEELGFELLKLDFAPTRGHAHLRLMLDRPGGRVSLDDCTRVSGAAGRLLDGLDLIPCRYRLEVTSPGVDRPLLSPRDFTRFAGSRVRIELKAPLGGPEEPAATRRNWTGRLAAYDAEADLVRLDTDEGEVRIPRALVARARLDPELLIPPRPARRGRL